MAKVELSGFIPNQRGPDDRGQTGDGDFLRSVAQAVVQLLMETDVLAHMNFLAQHRTKIQATHPTERLNKEVKRRTDVVAIFSKEESIIRLVGAVLLEVNGEWQIQHRYMQTEVMAELRPLIIDAAPNQIATVAA